MCTDSRMVNYRDVLVRLLVFLFMLSWYVKICRPTSLVIIGIFSSCKNTNFTNKETLKASIYQNLSQFMFEEDCILPVTERDLCKNFTQHVSYEAYDVCYDRQALLEVVLDVTLKEKYQAQENLSSIVMFLTYTSKTLFELIASLLGTLHWNLTPVLTFNTSYTLSYPFSESDRYQQMFYISPLLELVRENSWDSVGIILVTKNNSDVSAIVELEMRNSFIKSLRGTDTCYYSHTVNIDDERQLQGVVEKIRFERKYNQPLILFGERKTQTKFVIEVEDNFYESIKHLWVMHDVLQNNNNVVRSALMMSISRPTYIQSKKVIHEWGTLFDISLHKNRNHSLDLFISEAKSVLYHLKTYCGLVRNQDKTRTLLKKIVYYNTRNYWRNTVMFITRAEYRSISVTYYPGDLRSAMEHNSISTYKGLNCFVPSSCEAGTYLRFEKWQEEYFWNSQRGWRCVNCPINTFKSEAGHQQCTMCPSKTLVNKEHTLCYDPYRKVFLDTKTFTVQLCVGFSCFVSMLVTIFLLVLIKCHRTPVAHAMDLKVSILHLTLLLIHVLVSMFSFFGPPNFVRCIAQPACLSLLSTTGTSIVLVKSQKLLQVFQSKVKLEHRDVMLVTLRQTFVVLVNVIVSISILIFSLQIYWFQIDVVDNDVTLERSVSCDMSMHNNLQLGYQMLLQLACFVPAFRSRELPSIFNEAMTIVYLSFTLLVFNAVMFPIQYFQKETDSKTVVQWVFLNVNVFLVLLIYYSKKMFIMIFKKEKNTKEYFREKTMNSIKERVRKMTT